MSDDESTPEESARDDAVPLRLMLDADSERGSARLRVAGAFVALLAGVWLVLVETRWWLRLTGLTSVAFAVHWLLGYRKVRTVVLTAATHYLELTPDRFTLANGKNQRSIPLERVQSIELDHDRLVVVMRLRNGEELAIEPVYGRLSLRDLGETLQRATSRPVRTLDPGDARS
jgi:hypothetical protein